MNQRSRRFSTAVLLTIALLMVSYQRTPIVHASSLATVGIWSEAYNSPDIADPSIQPGTTVVVDINVTDAPPFNGYDLTMYWDPTYLQIQFVNIRGGAFPNPFVGAEDISPGQIRLAVVNIGNPFTGSNGVLAQIQFNVTGRGVSPLTLAAATTEPSRQAQSSTQLVFGYTEIAATTEDGYFSNAPGNPGPIASFTFSPDAPRAGDTITFNATESVDPDNSGAPNRGIESYNWDFGDGFFENSSTPVITYTYEFGGYPYTPFSGNFSARLTVVESDKNFEGMITSRVEVSPICPPGLVSIDVPRDCPTIQAAVESVAPGGTIRVSPGTYIEKPEIQKPLTLTGSGNSTILEGLIQIQAPNVTVSGFRIISNPFELGTGIELSSASEATIRNNFIIGQRDPLNRETALFHGITVSQSASVSIENNTVENELYGVSLQFSPHAVVQNNTLTNNNYNLDVSGSYIQDIGESNLLDGRPTFYGTPVDSSQIPLNAGYVGIVNSHDLQIGPISTANVGQGILVFNSTRITVDRLNATHILTAAVILNSFSIILSNSSMTSGSGTVDSCMGVQLDNVQQTMLENNTIDCRTGIDLNGSSFNWIEHNSFSTMILYESSLNRIERNSVSGNSLLAIDVEGSQSNIFVDNQIISRNPNLEGFRFGGSTGNLLINNRIDGGIFFANSPRNILEGNTLNSTLQGIEINSIHYDCLHVVGLCKQLPDYVQGIDPTNSINGRPIYYLVNSTDVSVPSNAGFVAVVNSTNILVQHMSLSFNYQDILVVSSRNVTIIDNNLSSALWGISGWNDTDLTIANNVISNLGFFQNPDENPSQIGMEIVDSIHGEISGNVVSFGSGAFGIGIVLEHSMGFTLEGNMIESLGFGPFPYVGIDFFGSSDNALFRNTVLGFHCCGQFRGFGTTGIQLGPYLSGSPSTGNLLVGNTLANHLVGLVEGSSGNTIYGNNFLNNQFQVEGGARDTWNDQTGRGNYWSDYSGQDTDNDGVGDTLLPVLGLDGYPLMSPWTPTGLASRLTGRAAWPEIRRLSISKQESDAQTLFALANNTGTAPEWVEVVFNVTSPNGSTSQLVSQAVWTEARSQTSFSVPLSVVPGSYRVVVTVKYSSDDYQKWVSGNSKAFSFQVVS